jgi:hypothetical protein
MRHLLDALLQLIGPAVMLKLADQIVEDAPLRSLIFGEPGDALMAEGHLLEEQQRRLPEEAYRLHELFGTLLRPLCQRRILLGHCRRLQRRTFLLDLAYLVAFALHRSLHPYSELGKEGFICLLAHLQRGNDSIVVTDEQV